MARTVFIVVASIGAVVSIIDLILVIILAKGAWKAAGK